MAESSEYISRLYTRLSRKYLFLIIRYFMKICLNLDTTLRTDLTKGRETYSYARDLF